MKTNLHNELEKHPKSADLPQAAHFPAYCCCSDPLQRGRRYESLGLDPWKIKGQML